MKIVQLYFIEARPSMNDRAFFMQEFINNNIYQQAFGEFDSLIY